MIEVYPTPAIKSAEGRLEWLLTKIYDETTRRFARIGTPVLIGGTALRRGYGLTRPSTDLDFAVLDDNEMKRLNTTIMSIARKRWPRATMTVRTDDETGWRIVDADGETKLLVGGMRMGRETLELAQWSRGVLTLPIGRLATMKIDTGLRHRNKVRDLYDMGFIAETYPGNITEQQARDIGKAGLSTRTEPNRWSMNHSRDALLKRLSLKEIGADVTAAARDAIIHIQGARAGAWMNLAQATNELHEAARQSPAGGWSLEDEGERVSTAWHDERGNVMWEGKIENRARARALLLHAGVEDRGHVSARNRMAQHKPPRRERPERSM